MHEQQRVVQRSDLIQLVYLGASGTRIPATGDAPFLESAKQIVAGRYEGTRVVHIDQLITAS